MRRRQRRRQTGPSKVCGDPARRCRPGSDRAGLGAHGRIVMPVGDCQGPQGDDLAGFVADDRRAEDPPRSVAITLIIPAVQRSVWARSFSMNGKAQDPDPALCLCAGRDLAEADRGECRVGEGDDRDVSSADPAGAVAIEDRLQDTVGVMLGAVGAVGPATTSPIA